MPASPTSTAVPATRPYNFALGALFSVLAVPLTPLVTIIIGQFGFAYSGLFGGLGIILAFMFFGKGSRRPTVRGFGFAFALLVGLVATTVGVVAGFISSVYYDFDAVGGKGGLLGSVFIGRVVYRVTERPEDFLIPTAIAVVMAVSLLIQYVKAANAARRTQREPDAAGALPTPPTEQDTGVVVPASGILLNGEPLDQQQPKKRFWQ